MNEYEPTGQAFRQFQYPTLPLSVSSDYRTRVLRAALDKMITTSPPTSGGREVQR
jgi:hypothetical protein